jgi:hypothetical protein
MYDRKTWIVVIACSILLAINITLQQKNAKAIAEQKKLEAPEQIVPAPDASTPAAPAEDKPGALVEAEPTAPLVEQFAKLETPETVFTFTSIGGGLKHAEFKNQTNGAEGPVRLNRHGSSPIGAIADGPDRVEGIGYEFLDNESVPGKSVVMAGRLPSGLRAKKTWSLVETGNPGDPYRLDLKILLENPGDTTVNLDSYSVFLGTAAPLDNVERGEQTGFVQNGNTQGSGLLQLAACSFACHHRSGFFTDATRHFGTGLFQQGLRLLT